MSRRNRGNVDLPALNNLSEGMVGALEKVQEMSKPAAPEKAAPREPVASELRDLVLFGKVVDTLVLGGYSFKLSTMSNKQQQRLVKKLVRLDNEERLTNVKIYTLAEAIISVNDQPLSDLYDGLDNSEDPMTEWEMAIEVLSEMQSGLIELLFDHYESLIKKSNSFFQDGRLETEVKN